MWQNIGFARCLLAPLLALGLLVLLPERPTAAEDAGGDKVVVAVTLASEPEQVESTLRGILDGAPLSIRSRGRTTVIETDTIGYRRLLANPTLASVRRISATQSGVRQAPRSEARPRDLVRLRMQLRTTPREDGRRPAISPAEDRTASHALRILQVRRFSDWLPPSPSAGPGMLVIRGLDAQGDTIYRRVIADPRLVRYEASAPDGRLTRRRDFIRTSVEMSVAVPFDSRVVSVSIAEPADRGGATAAVKELARTPIR